MATLTSLSLKPWARNSEEETAVRDVLARVNVERGHFRTITEASLQAEIAGDGALELSESEDDDEDTDEKGDGEQVQSKPTTRQELFNAKTEMLQHVAAAEQDVLMALDFVSLTLSKDAPGPANSTMSPALRQVIPPGTMGIDVWERMPQDKARQAQDELLATSVRMSSLQQSADDLIAAAHRLQDNVSKETQYWQEILAISEQGWNVCRIPGQQHRLGVTFGFSESAPQFSRRGIAALNVNSDGAVTLDRGFGAKPKALRVLLKENGATIGTSSIRFMPEDGETTLEARIRHARDSLFDEELYHEMTRESRSQASLGISMKGNSIAFRPTPTHTTEVVFELVSLDSTDIRRATEPAPQGSAAQAIATTSRLLLLQAHRERLKKRAEVPPPLSEKKDERPVLPILRPLMSFVLHQCAQAEVNTYLDRLDGILSAANVVHTFSPATFNLPDDPASLASADSLISTFMQTWRSEAGLTVTAPDQTTFDVKIQLETTLAYGIGTTFVLTTSIAQQAFRFHSFPELREAVDAALASGLARALAVFVGEGWKCNWREALLTKEGEDAKGESGTVCWVTVDIGVGGVLALNSPSQKVTWKAGGDGEEESLWDAFTRIAP